MIVARPELRALPPGIHGGRRALPESSHRVHDFSVCLNAFGPPAIVREAIARARIDEYPDPASRMARAAAAGAWQVDLEEIGFGAGAAELIQAACLAYLRRGDTVVIATPTFGEYGRAATLCGARIIACETRDDLIALQETIARTRPRLVFLCSPSSPFGISHGSAALDEVASACAASDALLVLDQAYDAFTAAPLGTPGLRGYPAVLHLRSLTKEFAIAGVRVAYAVGPRDVITSIERVRVPWSASALAEAAATACFTNEASHHVVATVGRLRDEANRIRRAVHAAGLETDPSDTHFFTIRVGRAASATARLIEAGVLVRDCTSFGLVDRIRIAARTPEENDALMNAVARLAPLLAHD
jgi:histidinol-phosphate aminotransferase